MATVVENDSGRCEADTRILRITASFRMMKWSIGWASHPVSIWTGRGILEYLHGTVAEETYVVVYVVARTTEKLKPVLVP